MTVAKTLEQLGEMLQSGEPLYLRDADGNPVPADTVHPALTEHLAALSTVDAMLRETQHPGAPHPSFNEWHLHHVRSGNLPVPAHVLRAVCGDNGPSTREERHAYRLLGDMRFCEQYPHLNPWPHGADREDTKMRSTYLREGHKTPDLQAAFDVDPDPSATVLNPHHRPPVRDGAATAPLLLDPTYLGFTATPTTGG